MKSYILIAVAAVAFSLFGKAVSTTWDTNPQKHIYGIGWRCPYPHCHETLGAFPKGLQAWEYRHLKQVQNQVIALHMRLAHGKGKPVAKK